MIFGFIWFWGFRLAAVNWSGSTYIWLNYLCEGIYMVWEWWGFLGYVHFVILENFMLMIEIILRVYIVGLRLFLATVRGIGKFSVLWNWWFLLVCVVDQNDESYELKEVNVNCEHNVINWAGEIFWMEGMKWATILIDWMCTNWKFLGKLRILFWKYLYVSSALVIVYNIDIMTCRCY